MFFRILKNNTYKNFGFTLIELVVSFSVIAIISTIGLAAFLMYSKSQSLQTAYLNLLNTLNVARSYSISQIKPTECSSATLVGYEVDLNFSSNSYDLVAKCQGFNKTVKTTKLPTNIKFNPTLTTTTQFLFPIISGNATKGTIYIDGYGLPSKVITVDSVGGVQ